MKNILFILAIMLLTKYTIAQKTMLQAPRGILGYLNVSIKSPKYNNQLYYEERYFVPTTPKPIRVDVSVATSGVTYGLIIASRTKQFYNASVMAKDTILFLPPAPDDTLIFKIFAAANRINDLRTNYSIMDADTAKLILSSKPKLAFEQILQTIATNFVPLLGSKNYRFTNYKTPNGFFNAMPAGIDFRNWVWQRTGYSMTAQESTADIAKWTTQITQWLKPYSNLTSKHYNKQELDAANIMGYQELQEFIQTDKTGKKIFVIYIASMQSTDDGKLYNEIQIIRPK